LAAEGGAIVVVVVVVVLGVVYPAIGGEEVTGGEIGWGRI